MVEKTKKTGNDISKKVKEIGDNTKKAVSAAKNLDIDELANMSVKRDDAYGDFARNYCDMKKQNVKGADGFYHARANCEAGQRGEIGKAIQVDIAKEVYDTYKKNKDKKGNLKDNTLDSLKDFKNDLYGLKQGVFNPKGDCNDLVKKFKVKGIK